MIRAALYGLGGWAERLLAAAQDSEHIRFVAGITRDPASRADLAARYSLRLTASFDEVLRDKEIDAVVITSPHSQHHGQIVAAARAGKHVFVEKPMTLTADSAREAVEACRKAGITLGVGFNRRAAPAYVEMLKRIRAGAIGDILHVEGHNSGSGGLRLKGGGWRAARAESPAGSMTPSGIHALDALIGIAGTIRTVYAHSDRHKLPAEWGIDDTTSMLLKFASGVTGYLGTVYLTARLWRVHVLGTQGWLEMRGDSELSICTLDGNPDRVPLPIIDKERATLENFARAIVAREPWTVPGDQAVNGIAVLQAIVASAESGQPIHIS